MRPATTGVSLAAPATTAAIWSWAACIAKSTTVLMIAAERA
jgi:hypothetical protein